MKSVKMNFVNYVTRFAIAVVLSGWLVSVAPQASAQVVGWAVGNKGTILRSTDGKVWKDETSPNIELTLRAVASPDGKTAWAVGDSPNTTGKDAKPSDTG